MKRKILSMVIVLCMLMAFVPCARAETVTYGYLTFDPDTGTITKCDTTAKEIIIPNEINGVTVKTIGGSAFRNCTSLTSVILPDSVTSIWDYAFYGCRSLTSITMPDSVTNIRGGVFDSCKNLASINVGSGNEYYSSIDGVLFNKDKTTIIQYPQGSERIAYTIPNSVTRLDHSAFFECTNLMSVTIPDSVTSVGMSVFGRCINLTDVSIGDGVKGIGDFAFSDCANLTNITIPNSVTTLGFQTFINCTNLTNITIPDSVRSIGSETFWGCTGLTYINVDSGNEYYSSIGGVLVNKDKTKIIQYPLGNKKQEYVIPNSITDIGRSAFSGCTSLTDITVGKNVTIIEEYAFDGCTSLTDVYYCGSESEWESIKIENYNTPLRRANIHYNYTGYKNPKIVGKPEVTNNKVNISTADVEYTSNMIAVFADTDGLVEAETVELTAGDTEKSVEIPSGATQAKIFIWDSLTGMRPLCEPVTVNISGE